MNRRFIVLSAVLYLACALPAAAQPERVLAFGDSITVGFPLSGIDCNASQTFGGYPPRLQQRLLNNGFDTQILNYGLCGEKTGGAVTRIDTVLLEPAEVILIMEGTNDLSGFVSMDTLRFNVAEMARKAVAAGVEPVIASVVPRGPEAGRDSSNERTGNFAGWLQHDSGMAGRVFADPFNAFFPIPELFTRFYADTYHPNAAGYDMLADVFVQPTITAIQRDDIQPQPCVSGAGTLCLNEGRFELGVTWEDFEGKTGTGRAVPLSDDTGYFWFVQDTNIELIIKVLDGRPSNDHFWVFYGALSNVAFNLTVTDTVSGQRRVYSNNLGNFASQGDTSAFFLPINPVVTPAAGDALAAPPFESLSPPPAPTAEMAVSKRSSVDSLTLKASCVADGTALCVNDGRFKVEVPFWRDFSGATGSGRAESVSEDTGYFWFFDSSNVELMIKVLDGQTFNGFYWVFYASLTNVEFTIRVTDMVTGAVQTYSNPLQNFASVGDTQAFPGSSP